MHSHQILKGLVRLQVVAGNVTGGVGLAAVGETMVYWHPPRSHDRLGQHPSVKWSLVLSAQEMFVPAAFEVPGHHSPPFAVRAYVLPYRILSSVTEPQNCSQRVREESLGGMVIALAKES
jgi:hypothetical protein